MSNDADAAGQIAVMAALLKLDIQANWHDDIAAHLKANAAAAALVLEHPLPDEIEAAPVFTA